MERGHVARRRPISRSASGLVLIGSSPYTLACTAKSASGAAGGFIGRQPVTRDSFITTTLYETIITPKEAIGSCDDERPHSHPTVARAVPALCHNSAHILHMPVLDPA